MAQVTSKYAIPYYIRWDQDGDIGTGGVYAPIAQIPLSGRTCYITWSSACKTFQVQWRVRRRYSPAKALAVSPSGAEVWEEWGEWQGSDLSEDVAIDAVCPYGNVWYLNQPFSFDYDFSEYDRHEYQVRVRVIDESSLLCSEWAYATLDVTFRPSWRFSHVERNAEGIGIGFECDNPGPIQAGVTKIAYTDGTTVWSEIGQKVQWLPEGGGVISMPVTVKKTTTHLLLWGRVYLQNGVTVTILSNQKVAIGAHVDDEEITAPSVSFDDADDATVLTIADAGYSNVFASAEWTDAYGDVHTEQLDVTGAWEARFPAPPYGVEVIYRVSVVGEGGWRVSEFIRTVEARGRMSFIDGDDYVELLYDTSWKADSSLEGEAVRCAGRAKPVARYGKGATTKVTAQGTLLFSRASAARTASAWLPEVQLLRSNRTWIFRNPLGERMNVMINSVAMSSEHSDIITLSISMTEVE